MDEDNEIYFDVKEPEDNSSEADKTEETSGNSTKQGEENTENSETTEEAEIIDKNGKVIKKMSPAVKKAIVVAAISLVICVVLCVVALVLALSPKKYTKYENLAFIDGNGNLCVNGEKIDKFASGAKEFDAADGSVVLVLSESNLQCYIVSEKKQKVISSNAETAVLSIDGSAAAYVDNAGTLKIYYTKTGKEKEIATGVEAENIVLSPKGKALAYTKLNQNDDIELYAWNGKKSKKIDTLVYGIAIDDKAEHIYCVNDSNNCLYSYDMAAKSVKLATLESDNYEIYFNRTASEAIVCDKENIYFVKNGTVSTLTAGVKIAYIEKTTDKMLTCGKNQDIVQLPAKTLIGEYWLAEAEDGTQKVFTFDDEMTAQIVLSNAGSPIVAKNSIFYIENDALCKLNLKSGESKEIATGVNAFVVSENGKKIYYRDNAGTLYFVSGKKSVKVAENIGTFAMTDKNLYYCSDGKVFGVKIGKTTAEEVVSSATSVTKKVDFVYCIKNSGDYEILK